MIENVYYYLSVEEFNEETEVAELIDEILKVSDGGSKIDIKKYEITRAIDVVLSGYVSDVTRLDTINKMIVNRGWDAELDIYDNNRNIRSEAQWKFGEITLMKEAVLRWYDKEVAAFDTMEQARKYIKKLKRGK